MRSEALGLCKWTGYSQHSSITTLCLYSQVPIRARFIHTKHRIDIAPQTKEIERYILVQCYFFTQLEHILLCIIGTSRQSSELRIIYYMYNFFYQLNRRLKDMKTSSRSAFLD
jgi:hypothetical protein